MTFMLGVIYILSVNKENSIIILSHCSILGITLSSNAKKKKNKKGKVSQAKIYAHCYLAKWYDLTILRKYSEEYFHFNIIVNSFDVQIRTEPYRCRGFVGLQLSKQRKLNKVLAKALHSFWKNKPLLTEER